jgi:multiple sugar transport system substrate-binding protein
MRKNLTALTAAMALLVTVLAGCGDNDKKDAGGPSGEDTSGTPVDGLTQDEIDAAMSTPTTLDYWTWVSDIQDEIDLFEAEYPAMTVNLVNNGGASEQYPKLRSAIQAGTDIPDVVQIGYDRLPSFLQTDSLLDLTPYGAAGLESEFTAGVWSQVANDDGIWAIPQDAGPMGLLYRHDIFAEAGVEVPTTWDEFASAAAAIHEKTGSCITDLPGNDWPMTIALFSQAGATPFTYAGGEEVGINLDSPQAQKVVAYWQDLIKKGLVCVEADFTDDWYQGFARSEYASWLVPAWGPMFLTDTAADTAGNWTAAEMPQWNAGEHVSANWGGSSNAVVQGTDSPIQAYMLAKFINTDAESTLRLANEQSLFPAVVATLENPAFKDYESEFFGGQQVNKVYSDISPTVATNLQWTPLGEYLSSSHDETLGKAIAEKGDLLAGLTAWQQDLVAYAESQGFTVTTG